MRLAINAVDESFALMPKFKGNQEVYLFVPQALMVIIQFYSRLRITISECFSVLFNNRAIESLIIKVDREMLPFSLQSISLKPDQVIAYKRTLRLT